MLQEEAQHLPRGIRPARIGVGAGRARSRPCVTGTMDLPLLEDGSPARIGMKSAGIAVSSRNPSAMHLRLRARRSPGLGDDMIAVARMHRGIGIAVEDVGRNVGPMLEGMSRRGGDAAVGRGKRGL